MVALATMIPVGSRVLDVGCGDGCFGLLYPERADLSLDGVDLDHHEASLARKTGAYDKVELLDISKTVPDDTYDVVLGNCSMEHVPDIHAAFRNIYRATKPGGRFLLLVPAFRWTRTIKLVTGLRKLSTRVGLCAAGAINGFFQHHHLYAHETWKMVVESHGFKVVSACSIGGPKVNRVFENGLPLALFEFSYKKVFKKYPNFTRGLRRFPNQQVLDECYEQPLDADSEYGDQYGVEYIVEAVKV